MLHRPIAVRAPSHHRIHHHPPSHIIIAHAPSCSHRIIAMKIDESLCCNEYF
jgi:hypothetical protein